MINNKKIYGKKGAWSITIVAALILTLVVLVLTINYSWSGIRESSEPTRKALDDLGDYDEDDVYNMYDKCPCTYSIDDFEGDLRGCPEGVTEEDASVDRKKYREHNCEVLEEEVEEEKTEYVFEEEEVRPEIKLAFNKFILGGEEEEIEISFGTEDFFSNLIFDFEVENEGNELVEDVVVRLYVEDLDGSRLVKKNIYYLDGEGKVTGTSVKDLPLGDLDVGKKGIPSSGLMVVVGSDDACVCAEQECSCYLIAEVAGYYSSAIGNPQEKIKVTLKKNQV